MATIILCIIPSRPNRNGTYAIRFKITNVTTVAYITTKYYVEKKQWTGAQVVHHPQASMINSKLFQLLTAYQSKLDEIDPPREIPALKLKEWLMRSTEPSGSFVAFGGAYVARLRENGQTSYADNMSYTIRAASACLGEYVRLKDFTYLSLERFERYLKEKGQSNTTINIRMSHLKALLNYAVKTGIVEYRLFPFLNYKMPQKNVRDICISKSELARLRDAEFTGPAERRFTIARDLFMLSFYCAGINLTDILDARLDGNLLTFVRKKTALKKQAAEKEVSITIQPEARAIIDKYIGEDGKLNMGYNYRDYEQFRSFVTKSLSRIGEELGFEKKLMFYSARKTFVQFGADLGVPLYILEYAIGQTIKDKANRPIFNYFKVMRTQADMAIRAVIGYSRDMEEEEVPIPEWARKYVVNQ